MKPFLFSIITLLSTVVFGQNEIKWKFGYDANSQEVIATALLEKDWHVYSILPNEGGPVPTSFVFKKSAIYELKGGIIEPEPTQVYDENFATTVQFFSNEVTFKQPIQIKNEGTIEGSVVYMICNDQMCFPPEEVLFSISITK